MDLGVADIGDSITQAITIHNSGTGPLNLSGHSITGPDGHAFTMTGLPLAIATGGSFTFDVTFSPDREGGFDATLSIDNDDADENPYNFNLYGSTYVDICPGFDDNADADGDGLPDGCDSCPNDAENDADGDGVCGDIDSCEYTASGALIDDTGCSIDDYCPCDDDWKNHGEYVSCFTTATDEFVAGGLFTSAEAGALQSEAGQSSCGHKDNGSGCNQGTGNGPEGCDPGNSNNNQPSNDEGEGDVPGNGGRKK